MWDKSYVRWSVAIVLALLSTMVVLYVTAMMVAQTVTPLSLALNGPGWLLPWFYVPSSDWLLYDTSCEGVFV